MVAELKLRQQPLHLAQQQPHQRTPSYNRRLSDGARMSVAVVALSMRTCVRFRSPVLGLPQQHAV
jgi:hypothetical protein